MVPVITTEIHEHANPEWVNPHSWESRDDRNQCMQTIDCAANEKKMKHLEGAYKRLVYNIFDRSKFKVLLTKQYLFIIFYYFILSKLFRSF